MAIIAVANLKGGVGKSTIAVNLAHVLGAALVDADAQATAARWGAAVDIHPLPLDAERDAGTWARRVLALDARFVVIDCPPHVGAATRAAIGVADLVLIPVAPSGADLIATATAIDLVREARERRGTGPGCLLVPSRVDGRTAAGREVEGALKQFGEPVGPTVRQRAAFVDAFGAMLAISDYAPRSDAAADIKALAGAVRRKVK